MTDAADTTARKGMRASIKAWFDQAVSSSSFLFHPFSLLGITLSFGFFLIILNAVFGYRSAESPDVWTLQWALGIGEKVGLVLAVSGVLGVVSRLLWMTGTLSKVLAELMFSDAVLDKRGDLTELHQRLTQRIYLRGFKPRTPLDQAFLRSVHEAIDKSITQKHSFYVRNVDAHFRLEEIVGESDRLRIIKTIQFDVHPYDASASVRQLSSLTAANDIPIADYEAEELEFTVDGQPPLSKREIEVRGNRIIYSIDLPPKTKHTIRRVFSHVVFLNADPTTIVAAPYVTENLTFRATCDAPGLKTFFTEVGVDGAFEDMLKGARVAKGRGDQSWRNTGILLPEQGFTFVVQKSL